LCKKVFTFGVLKYGGTTNFVFGKFYATAYWRHQAASDEDLAPVPGRGSIGIAGSIAAGSAFGSAVLRTCTHLTKSRIVAQETPITLGHYSGESSTRKYRED